MVFSSSPVGRLIKSFLASTFHPCTACAHCPNRVTRRAWIITVSFGCFVCLQTSSLQTKWYHLMPSNIRRHHWSSALILRTSVETAQHSDPYRKTGRMHGELAQIKLRERVMYMFQFSLCCLKCTRSTDSLSRDMDDSYWTNQVPAKLLSND